MYNCIRQGKDDNLKRCMATRTMEIPIHVRNNLGTKTPGKMFFMAKRTFLTNKPIAKTMKSVKFIAPLLVWTLLAPSFLIAAPISEDAATPVPMSLKSKGRRQNSGGLIEVVFRGLRNSLGKVTCYLFRGKDGFPENKDKTVAVLSVPIADKQAKVVFSNLPPGEYAVAILHDENENKAMDYNFIGMPKEGWAFSNLPSGVFRKPKFDECAFKLDCPKKTVVVNMTYMN